MDQGDPTRRFGCDSIGHGSRPGSSQDLVACCWSDRRLGCPRLASRELQVLGRLEEAKAYKQIALALSVSESLIHKLVHRVFLQLGAHKRTEALAHWWACCACPNADWLAACRAVSAPGSETTPARSKRPCPRQQTGHCPRLSERELKVLQHVACGLSDKEIAAQVDLELPLVKKLARRMMLGFGARNRTEASLQWLGCLSCARRELQVPQEAAQALPSVVKSRRQERIFWYPSRNFMVEGYGET